MVDSPPQTLPAALPCHRCGYDLRAQPPDGVCPECNASVAEARRVDAIPRRPAWRDSDPRWRRRTLLGVWILVLLLPAMTVLNTWGVRIPVPTVFDWRGNIHTLTDTLIAWEGFYQPLVFCMGVVLLFSRERGRRDHPLDWTRRWGVLCSYAVLLLGMASFLLVAALVLAGIAALFQTMPPKYQPAPTQLFVELSTRWLRYGPNPRSGAAIVQFSFSWIVMLLACVSLYQALRSAGPRWWALLLLVPLALFSIAHLLYAAGYWLFNATGSFAPVFSYGIYFAPNVLFGDREVMRQALGREPVSTPLFLSELAKWSIMLVIALWLTAAQMLAWRRRRTPQASVNPSTQTAPC